MQFRVIVVTDPSTHKQTHPATNKQTGPITIRCAAASAQYNKTGVVNALLAMQKWSADMWTSLRTIQYWPAVTTGFHGETCLVCYHYIRTCSVIHLTEFTECYFDNNDQTKCEFVIF